MTKFSANIILVLLNTFLFVRCTKNYNRSITVCEGKLFVERYDHPYIDVAYYYLTDSTSFRMYVGKFDNEHGGYSFKCKSDSLEMEEMYEGKIMSTRNYNLVGLRKLKEGF